MSQSTLAAGIRQLRGKLALHGRSEESDAQLVQLFLRRRDDSAFAALVRRHGPMVFHVCLRILGHQQDAEDAFQATFLVFAQQAASLYERASLAGFLHGIAVRTALKARQSIVRRSKHEGRASARLPADPVDELSWREVRTLLDEEIARLPEIYRSAFVLRCLQGVSEIEAAQRLGVKRGTLSSRLVAARKLLQRRLARRGVELTAVLAAVAVATPTASALPAGLMAKTIQAAIASAAGEGLAGIASASVAELVQSMTAAMFVSKAKMATLLLITTVLLAGAGMWTSRTLATQNAANTQGEPAKSPRAATKDRQASREDKGKEVKVSGRVLDPNGKPVRGARLYLPLLKGEQLRSLATSDDTGQFSFRVLTAEVRIRPWLRDPWRYVNVVAVAEGYGLGFAALGGFSEVEKLVLRLAKDEVAINGRVLDLQGKPIAGATVRVVGVGVPKKGDLTAFLDELKGRTDTYPAEDKYLTTVVAHEDDDLARILPSTLGFISPVTTDADGRFRITGIGDERVAHLSISGPTIVTRQVAVRTRPGKTMYKLPWANYWESARLAYYGAAFEHVAEPTKPIVGVVRDKSTGKPVAKATVRAYRLAKGYDGENLIRTITDKDGRYRLVGMPKGDNEILAELPAGSQYLRIVRRVEDTPGLDPVTVDVELRRGVLVKGRVTDKKTGEGVAAQIEYFVFLDESGENPFRLEFRSSLYRQGDTEADGSFQMVVPTGRILIAARASSNRYLVGVGAEKMKRIKPYDREVLLTEPQCDPLSYNRLLEIDAANDVQTLTCHFEVDPGRKLTGAVVGADSKPLAGARICGLRSNDITFWEPEPMRTAEFTAYALTPGRPRRLQVIHEGKHLAGSLVVRGDEKAPVQIKLQPWGTIAGRLVTPAGDSYTKGELRFMYAYADKLTDGSHPFHSIPRDKRGRFRVEGLVPGLKYHLLVLFPNGRGGRVIKVVTVPAGEAKDLGDITVKPIP